MTTLKMMFKTEKGAQLGGRLRASDAAVQNVLTCAKKNDFNRSPIGPSSQENRPSRHLSIVLSNSAIATLAAHLLERRKTPA
jgi:hypothetical protein